MRSGGRGGPGCTGAEPVGATAAPRPGLRETGWRSVRREEPELKSGTVSAESTKTRLGVDRRGGSLNLAAMRIVLVDDHEFLRIGLRARLTRAEAGFEVVGEAGNAAEACAVVAETQPDLVVLDLNLPGVGGAEVAATIRGQWPKIKILILSGANNEAAAVEAIRAGADGFVRKEEAAGELLRAISVVQEGKTYLSPAAAVSVVHTLRVVPEARADEGSGLADREVEVLRRLAEGLSYKEIAAEMNVGVRTVETYRARIVEKLGCSTRAELVRYAVRQGLVSA